MPEKTVNPVALTQDLIRCKSVTPDEGGAITLLENLLATHGFECHRLAFSESGYDDVVNLYACKGKGGPVLGFAGHTDVVPAGSLDKWDHDPFCGDIIDGYVYGRGAADMKSGIAAMVAACIHHTATKPDAGTVCLVITGNEEGDFVNGTPKMLEWMKTQGKTMDACIVGEPTSRETMGDMIKIGRRGSLLGRLTVTGKQGHVAYPHLADNPLPRLVTLLKALDDMALDDGNDQFQPSNLEIASIDVGNPAYNVIPASGKALFGVRFNNIWTNETLQAKIRATLDATGLAYDLSFSLSGESFLTPAGPFSAMVAAAVEKHAGRKPELSTSGGTSDARFIKDMCPVVECGIVGDTAHKHNERVRAEDIVTLTRVYADIINDFMAS